MKKNMMTMLATAALLALTACNNSNQFKIEGTVEGATDSVLYLEHMSLAGPTVLDSTRLGSSGTFAFSQKAPEAPDFYRLRIYDQIINLSIDSTETVGIKAQYPNMASRYEVSGSDNCQKIRELSLKQMALQQKAIELDRSTDMSRQQKGDSLQVLLDAYKDDVKRNYIFKEPYKAYAYFALFQTLGPWLIFNPQSNKDDMRVFAAVATSWDTYYPGAERGQNLHNIAIEGMKNQRIANAQQSQSIDASIIEESGLIDITLTDNHGQQRSLSDLKGKVVLLDFHLFALDDSPQRILALREYYNKYHQQGLEIFQVSLDADEHFWKQMTQQLPWVSVRDKDALASRYLQLYNVPSVPDYFLIDRNNYLVKRASQMKDVDAEIRKLL